MSDAVVVALIAVGGNLLVVIVSRWLSHNEHRKTNATVDRIEKRLNGATYD